jgi:hypothetical protein
MFGRFLTLPRDGPGLMGRLPPVANTTARASPSAADRVLQRRRHPAAFDWDTALRARQLRSSTRTDGRSAAI